jgi:hypothetical protein
MMVTMPVSHDMSPAAETHHEKDECSPDQEVAERLHRYASSLVAPGVCLYRSAVCLLISNAHMRERLIVPLALDLL